MGDNRIRTLVVDDSALMRAMIPTMLETSPEIEVVGTASNPFTARDMIKSLAPDVITLDVEMPKMDGISFLEKIMSLRPMPVVMVSSLTQEGADITLRALELGAVDFVAKPQVDLERAMPELAGELVAKVRAAASAPVRVRARRTAGDREDRPVSFRTTEKIIAIGASTGGVELLGKLLSGFPADAPATVIAQHMPSHFTRQFSARLDGRSAAVVSEAEDGQVLKPGQVVIAPGGRHLSVTRSGTDYVCRLTDGDPVSGHKPSVDVLFNSVAQACGANAVGVILTGMGRDGARGLLAMREAGAATIGQDEKTSLVYGMPKVAYEIGAVLHQVPQDKILPTISELCSPSGTKTRS